MKTIYIFIVFVFALASRSFADSPPQGDPTKPYYQKKVNLPCWPPILKKVNPHKPQTIAQFKEQLKRERLQWNLDRDRKQDTIGLWVKITGIAVLVFSAVCHFSTSFPLLKSIASSIATLGAGVYLTGLLIQREAQWSTVVDWALFIALLAAIGFILYRYKDQSLSHVFNRNNERTPPKD